MSEFQMNLYMYFWVWLPIVLTAMVGLVLLTRNPKVTDFISFGVIVAGILVAFAILHPRETPLLGDARTVQAQIGAGTPVLLEFQSPY
jgi:hypothetical protein